MKKLFLLAMIALASVGINAQTVKGEGSLMGNIGYQTNYERFGLGVQGRYAIANNLRIAPDVTFYFPKDKITGLDVSVKTVRDFPYTLLQASACKIISMGKRVWK